MQDLIYGTEPTVAVFADRDMAADRLAALATDAGARVLVRGGIGEAIDLLDAYLVNAVLVDVADDGGSALDRLLERLDAEAVANRMNSVVLIAPALIDIAVARAPNDGVALLCNGSALDEVAALSLALTPRPALVFQERGDDLSAQLRRVREEVARIARALATVAGGEDRPVALPEPTDAPLSADDEPGADLLRRMIRVRRLRDRFFHPELFADPAWDMLLDLMLARMEGRPVAVSSLCIAAAVPPTTALRWIKRLTDDGLFVRTADPLDGRRVFIDLSEAGALCMLRYLRTSVAADRANG